MRVPRVRFTTWRMMVATAVLAVLCSSLPYPFAAPLTTLTTVVLVVLIFAIPTRREDPKLFKGVLLLVLITALAAVAQQSYSLWLHASSYRRLSLHHARCEMTCRQQIQSLDKDPGRVGGGDRWASQRPRWLQWSEYHGHLKLSYDHAARNPWLSVEPDPPQPL
jgi:hypothetical protein